jgi:hypothetical protein
MSGRAGSDCPECGGQLDSDDGMDYECRDCGRKYDSADVFLILAAAPIGVSRFTPLPPRTPVPAPAFETLFDSVGVIARAGRLSSDWESTRLKIELSPVQIGEAAFSCERSEQ